MKEYTFEYIKKFHRPKKYLADEVPTIYDGSISRWVYKETLAEKDERWYLTVDFTDKGDLDYYFLDYDSAYVDAHYKFKMPKEDAEKLFGDKDVYLHVLMKEYLKEHTGDELKALIEPFILERYAYY